MTLEELLLNAARATSSSEALARKVAAQLRVSSKATPELSQLSADLEAGLTRRWRTLKPLDLGCARAAVNGLAAMKHGVSDERASMSRWAVLDAENEKKAVDRYGQGRWRCPRCGSQRIDDEHTARDTQRYSQLLCDACGMTGDGLDGAASLQPWRLVRWRRLTGRPREWSRRSMSISPAGPKTVENSRPPISAGVVVPTWVLKAVPDDSQANKWSNEGVELLKQGKPKEALVLFERALAQPKDERTDRASLLNRKGVALSRLGDQPQAIINFAQSGLPNAIYNEGVSTLKIAIADSGQLDAYKADRASIDPNKLDATKVDYALNSLKRAVLTNNGFFSELAKGDADWAPLANIPTFRALVGLPALPATSVGASGQSAFTAPPLHATTPEAPSPEAARANSGAARPLGFDAE